MNASNILLEKEILLESGTNELEVLVFRVGSYCLGINVAKVREILPSQQITHLPKTHPSVRGCFRLRDVVVPCVSLHTHLKQPEGSSEETNLILTEFNDCQTAFVVDEVERIHRISWEQIIPAPPTVMAVESPVTAVTNLEGRLVILLDFETISAEISQRDHDTASVENPYGLPRDSVRILVADDSATVRLAVETTLRQSGYTNVKAFEHGQLAWDFIQSEFKKTGDIKQVAGMLVSDVEMPAMDGLTLTRNIKENTSMQSLPVVLYSSIVTPGNRKKGESVGANAQIAKPEFAKIVHLADELALGAKPQESVLEETAAVAAS